MDNWRKLSGCAVSSLCTWLVSSALILCTQQVWNALSPLRLCPRGRLLGCRIAGGGGGRRLSDPKPKPSWAGQTFASASSSLRDRGLHHHVLARVSRVWSPLSSVSLCSFVHVLGVELIGLRGPGTGLGTRTSSPSHSPGTDEGDAHTTSLPCISRVTRRVFRSTRRATLKVWSQERDIVSLSSCNFFEKSK